MKINSKGFAKFKILLIAGGVILLAGIAYMVYRDISSTKQSAGNKPSLEEQEIILDDLGISPENIGYSIGESNFKNNPEGTVTWAIQVHKSDSKNLRSSGLSTAGAQVTVEHRTSKFKDAYTNAVGDDGWVYWTTETPQFETKIYLMNITGDVEWILADRQFWSSRPILSWLDNAETEN